MDLLAQHHEAGFRFGSPELIEEGDRVALQRNGQTYMVFTFERDDVVLIEDVATD